MATAQSSYHESSMQSFRAAVEKCQIKAICGRTFIRVENLKALVTEQVDRLIEAAYQRGNRNDPALPIRMSQICREHNCALLIFCILLEMGYGHVIHYFHKLGIGDSRLGDLDSVSLRQTLSDMALKEKIEVEEFAKEFTKRQWRYSPVKFEYEDMSKCKPQQIIPIHRRESINNKGFTASVWQVEVLEEFIGPRMREYIATSRYTGKEDNLGYRYSIAQKTFEESKKAFFEDEVRAFQSLQGHEGMIRYLGDYSQRDFVGDRNTYNILLEYGEHDLEEYFFNQGHLPPVLPAEIHKFWIAIFALADAVRDIHSFKKSRGGVSREFFGWHADIKPDNILKVKERFKLADPGFACFELSNGQARLGSREQTTNIQGGTTTYGAPECHPGRKTRSPVPRSIDIWSLGCVFSVTATWVVLGDQGILQFSKLREKALRAKIAEAKMAHSRNDVVILQPGDYFHDGETVLPVVKDWHQHLRNSARGTDTITNKLLDLVDKHMLCGKAKDRVSAKDLCLALTELLRHARQENTASLPRSLEEALVEMDKSAPSAPSRETALLPRISAPQGGDSIQDRKMRKSTQLEHPLMKTAHRSELLKAMPEDGPMPFSTLRQTSHHPTPALQSAWEPPSSAGNRAPAQPVVENVAGSGHAGDRLSHQSSPPPFKKAPTAQLQQAMLPANPSPSNGPQKQNMWQVHEQLGPLRNKFTKKYPKDATMSEYFDKRDIKFLIDNADSMADYWAEAIYLLEALTMKACGQDEDGMDIDFVHGNISLKGKKKPRKISDMMKQSEAKPNAARGHRTDLRKKLEDIFHDYLISQKKHDRHARKLVIIIFTDGKWDAMDKKYDMEGCIVEFVDKLKAAHHGYVKDRPVSLQFIRFGDDEDAKCRLQRLDDDLVRYGVPDIIDTEDSRGDVNKMLVGSFDPIYDSTNEFKPIPSRSSNDQDSFLEQHRPNSYVSEDQRSQISPAMDHYAAPHTAAQQQQNHYPASPRRGHPSPPAGFGHRTTQSKILPLDSRKSPADHPS